MDGPLDPRRGDVLNLWSPEHEDLLDCCEGASLRVCQPSSCPTKHLTQIRVEGVFCEAPPAPRACSETISQELQYQAEKTRKQTMRYFLGSPLSRCANPSPDAPVLITGGEITQAYQKTIKLSKISHAWRGSSVSAPDCAS